MSQPWRVFGLLACGGLLAAACSSSPNHSNGSTTTTSLPPTTSSSLASTSTSTTSATTTSGAASGCTSVTAVAGPTSGAAGTITGSVVLSSTSSTPCNLTGYPAMSLFASNGSSLPVTIIDGLSVSISPAANGSPKSVTLSASSKLDFTYEFSDVPTGSQTSCPTSSLASISLPGGVGTTPHFALMLNPCNNGTIRVSPLYPHT